MVMKKKKKLNWAVKKINESQNHYNPEASLRKSIQRFQGDPEFRKQCYFQLSVADPVRIINRLDNLADCLGVSRTNREEEEQWHYG